METDARTRSRADDLDPAVVDAARRGDSAAFVRILRRYDHLLRLVAFRVLRDPGQMDDVMQEVAIRAFRGLQGFRGDASVSTWLCRLTYTASVDAVRRRRPEDATDHLTLDDLSAPMNDPAEDVLERAALRSAFAGLTLEHQLSVLLVDRVGYDYDEAAEILGISSGTVASRLSRARAALRQAILLAAESSPSRHEDPR